VRHNVTINNLLPGVFATDAQRNHIRGIVEMTARPYDELWEERGSATPAGRYGEASEFGAYCAFLCSAHAGYITGQNLLIDAGAYPGTY
jgi:3-oxoacyl-[acyl-carrier protein] reductase